MTIYKKIVDVFESPKPSGMPEGWRAVAERIRIADGEAARGDYLESLIEMHAVSLSCAPHPTDDWPELTKIGGAMYRVLRLLVSNYGRIVHYSAVSAAMMGDWPGAKEPSNVDMNHCIKRLRKRLRPDRGSIEVIYGIGYRMTKQKEVEND